MHPRRQLNEKLQLLDDLQISLARCARAGLRNARSICQNLSQRLLLLRPSKILLRQRQSLREVERRLGEPARLHLKTLNSRLANAGSRLRLLSPMNVLERGYSITSDAQTGKVLRDVNETRSGQRLKTRLKSGEVRSVVEDRLPSAE